MFELRLLVTLRFNTYRRLNSAYYELKNIQQNEH